MTPITRTLWLAAVLGAAAPAAAQDVNSSARDALFFAGQADSLEERRQGVPADSERRQREAERRAERLQQESERRQQRAEQQRRRVEQQRQRAEQQRRARQQRAGRDNIRNWPEVTEAFSRTIRLPRNGTLDIENVAGDIAITGGGGDDVRIDAIRRMRNPDEAQARAMLQDLRVEVAERGGAIEVRTFHPRGRNSSGAVDYTVAVPNGAAVLVKTVSGNVRISNVRGEVRAQTVSGGVSGTSLARLQSAKSISGTVEIADAEGGDVNAGSVSGDVIIRNLKGRSVDLQTVSGGVRMTDIDVERAMLRSVSGHLDYSGRLARNGRYELQSHSGDVRIAPVGNAGFDLEANTFSGNLQTDFELKLTQGIATGARGPQNRNVRGTFGDPGARVLLRSFSGNITLTRR